MKTKLIYILTTFCYLSVGFAKPHHRSHHHHPVKVHKSKSVSRRHSGSTKSTNEIHLSKVSYAQLPGWQASDVQQSFKAFQNSCNVFFQKEPSKSVGTAKIKLKAADWYPACKASRGLTLPSSTETRRFFEKWFNPVEFKKSKPIDGLFTGYYMPEVEGSEQKTAVYNTPLYGLPDDLKKNHRGHNYFTRAEIDRGALQEKAPVLAWIHSPVERLFLEIEGAGVVKLPDGKNIYLGYAGENGASYTSISGLLIKKGLLNKDKASSTAIKNYLESHPQTMQALLQKNKSFVFFENLEEEKVLGANGITLTPGASLAIDRKWIPMGAPLWLDTKKPDENQIHDKDQPFQSLMIAQDTGGAIKGVVRGDVFWGWGKQATWLAEHMKNAGRYWLLLPKHLFTHGAVLV